MASATIVLSTVFGKLGDMLEPSARNSNLLPVNANGLVRFRSPVCFGSARQHRRAEPHELARRRHVDLAARERVEDVLQLGAEEDRDDRRRRLVGAQAVVLPGGGHRGAQQALVGVDGLDRPRRRRTGTAGSSSGVSPGSSRFSPVSVPIDQLLCLPEPLTPANGFSCSSATRSYFGATVLEHGHQQLLVVAADVGVLEDRRDLVLRRRDLVVARLDRHAELQQLALGVEHARQDPLRDAAEVVVVELVALRRLGAEQGAAGVDQVGALVVVALVDQEVLLLGPHRRGHARRDVGVAEQVQARGPPTC